MKKLLLLLGISFLLFGCTKDKFNNDNPFLANIRFTIQVNMNLPTYNNLQFPGNSVKVNEINAGNRGIIVFNSGAGYNAFDGACPNQALNSCSTLSLNGNTAICPCDDAEYSLFTGQATGKQYPLKPYRVEVNGNMLIISN